MFSSEKYHERLATLARYVKQQFPADFQPSVALTLGSGGTGDFANELTILKEIPYSALPEFFTTTVPGHAGKLVLAKAQKTDVIIYSGRKHFYELGYQGDVYSNLKEIVLPVYLAYQLGAELYIATNAAGGLNPEFKVGDIMLISSHFDLFFPNVLAGPEITIDQAPRFQPQDQEYSRELRQELFHIGQALGISSQLHQGVYAAVTGPTFESTADSLALRKLGIDAVGMSTVPEVITAANMGMLTLGFSLITNLIKEDGTNATSHAEVQASLSNPEVKERFYGLLKEFLNSYASKR